ncbi:MAG TPA: glycosyltransferase family 4 protein [Candidatus Hydrothermia bacterium]|nr:glycosyltransferase family 4 protein [Candidatus Hydrothermia bacterium]HOL24448.1 glycosyltransferase family 4 protein [Candidatus Hydrothermia bacterium]HPO79449.1 glycosyltransferase family 4 protein [Candidatus Hydrothermia bacterium]
MKILIIHNFYKSSAPSGEDIVFRREYEMLKENGASVLTYTRHNDEMTGLRTILSGVAGIWSWKTYNDVKRIIRTEKPDVAHFHNIWYLISPSAYYACKEEGVPIVQTLHNYRMFCSNGLLLREGKVCEECLRKSEFKSIKYGCYRNSRVLTFPVALAEQLHRKIGTWDSRVDLYIAVSEFQKKKFTEYGIDCNKIVVKPNFILDLSIIPERDAGYVLYVGRISEEKGVLLILKAAKLLKGSGIKIKLIGDGPLRERMSREIVNSDLTEIELLGRKKHEEVIKYIQKSKFLIVPSIWYETFGLVAVEAYACGKAVVASKIGALEELVQDGKTGLLFEPGNPYDLAKKIEWLNKNDSASRQMGINARKVYEEKYTKEKNFEILKSIYKTLIEKASKG